jgi:hypothetical protein
LTKPRRNDPCPCGSGKKYKRCCYLKEESAVSENSAGPQDLQGNFNDFFKDPEFFMKTLTNFRRLFLDRMPHIKEYYKIRKLHGAIVDSMIQYFDDGKFIQKIDTDSTSQAAHDPELYLFESEFDLETREGSQGFYDMVIYKPAPNINCIAEDFIQKHRYRKAEKVEFLYSMLHAKSGLFEIIATKPEEGYAYLREVFTGAEYKIIDVGLSGDRNYRNFYLYTRILDYHGISFGTGLNLVFNKNDSFIKEYIKQQKKDYSPLKEFVRFIQLYNRYSKYNDRVKVVANTLG